MVILRVVLCLAGIGVSSGLLAQNGTATMPDDKSAVSQAETAAQVYQGKDLVPIEVEASWRVAGYINAKGEIVIPLEVWFGSAGPFADNGLARVSFLSDGGESSYGYINAHGRALPSSYEAAMDFSANGLAGVKKSGKWGYINAQGEMVIPPKFEKVESFAANGLAQVFQNGKWGYINARGEMVIPPGFAEAESFAANGLAMFGENGKYGYIDALGKMVIPPRFDYARGFAANGLAGVFQNGKWGYINARGKMVIPPRFEDAESFADNGLARIQESGKYGYIDAQGKMAIPPKFDDATGFDAKGLARVKENGKWGYIDAQGEMVIPPRFEGADPFAANGLAKVEENGKWIYINAKGQIVVYEDKVFCGVVVLKNGRDEILWPKKTVTQICGAESVSYVESAVSTSENTAPAHYAKDLVPIEMTGGDGRGITGYINAKGEMVIPPRFGVPGHGQFNAGGFVWMVVLYGLEITTGYSLA